MTSAHNEKGAGADHIIVTPMWMLIVRFFQFLLSIIILGLAGWTIHGAYIETLGLAIAIVRDNLTLPPKPLGA